MRKKISLLLQGGFYLYELLISAVISSIFLLMTSVSFRSWHLRLQARQLQQELISSLHSSAMLARRLQHRIQLCGISRYSGCDKNWSKGWQVIDWVTHQVLSSHYLPGKLSLVWGGSLGRPVRFAPTGRPDGIQGGWHCRLDGRELFHLILLRVM